MLSWLSWVAWAHLDKRGGGLAQRRANKDDDPLTLILVLTVLESQLRVERGQLSFTYRVAQQLTCATAIPVLRSAAPP